MASRRNGTLYTGVTSDLARSAYDHRQGTIDGFSKRYHCKMLVYYQRHETMIDAISEEKRIKGGSRADKLRLIEAFNPDWLDLYETLA